MRDSQADRSFIPQGWHTVTPRIVVQGAREFVDFLARVFSATGDFEESRPSTIRLGNSVVLVSEVGVRSHTPAFLYVYVEDADSAYACAVGAGARAIEQPFETPYGDRRCMVEDPWGNTWQIATYKGGNVA